MKIKEFLVIFILAILITTATGFISHPYPCPSYPDALCSVGYPLIFHRVGGIMGMNEWYWTNLTIDFLFWFLVIAGGWWVIKKFKTDGSEAHPQLTGSNRKLLAAIIISVLLTAILTGTAVYFWQKSENEKVVNDLKQKVASLKKQISTLKKVETAPQPQLPPSGSTKNWKNYQTADVTFKYPSQWIEEPIRIVGSGFIQEFKDPEGRFFLTFSSTLNYNQVTGKPYASLDEYMNMRYKVKAKAVIVDGQEVRQPFPRAGSENINSIVFFSKDSKLIYTLELQLGDNPSTMSEIDFKENQQLFNQIISTVRFMN